MKLKVSGMNSEIPDILLLMIAEIQNNKKKGFEGRQRRSERRDDGSSLKPAKEMSGTAPTDDTCFSLVVVTSDTES